tara:strand:- start:1872 stop:2090 length:219 start_codon:yes stop_codon:yes gene_type:complete
MNATQLVQEIKDANAIQTLASFEIQNENHEIDIFFSQSRKKWLLFFDGRIIKDAKNLEPLVNKLQSMNLIGA